MTPLFSHDAQWERMADILHGWIGTPYRHCAGTKTGSDCGSWIARVFHELGIVQDILAEEYYSRQWYMSDRDGVVYRRLRLYCDNLVSGFTMQEESPDSIWIRGDILVFKLPRAHTANHLGIYFGCPRPHDHFMVHCLRGPGMHKAAFRTSWQRFLIGIFRIYQSD